LGEGKFGVVTLAKSKRTGGVFALKKVPKAMIKSHMMVEQLSLELRIQSCVNHRNILGMYGFFEDKTHLYIVLEYMDGGTLYEQLKNSGKIPEKETASIIRQITSAIDYLHDIGIAHRDLKPENVVISNVLFPRPSTSTSSATSAGLPFATNDARPTVEPLTMWHLKSSRGPSTT